MKCNNCKAADEGKCKAGIVPRFLRNGEIGCSCNSRQVEKHMREKIKKENKEPITLDEILYAISHNILCARCPLVYECNLVGMSSFGSCEGRWRKAIINAIRREKERR